VAFYSGCGTPPEETGEHQEVVGRAKRREAGTSDEGDGMVRRD
jgi:hypothetical protein